MHKYIDLQASAANPAYSQGIEAVGPLRWLSISGQVGRDANGAIPDGIEAQAEIAWRNVARVLQESNMETTDLFDVTVYLINREDSAGFDKARRKWLNGARPTSTKIYVSGLANPKLLCEIQALAAKPIA